MQEKLQDWFFSVLLSSRPHGLLGLWLKYYWWCKNSREKAPPKPWKVQGWQKTQEGWVGLCTQRLSTLNISTDELGAVSRLYNAVAVWWFWRCSPHSKIAVLSLMVPCLAWFSWRGLAWGLLSAPFAGQWGAVGFMVVPRLLPQPNRISVIHVGTTEVSRS